MKWILEKRLKRGLPLLLALVLIIVAIPVVLLSLAEGEDSVRAEGFTVNVHIPTLSIIAGDGEETYISYTTDAYFATAEPSALVMPMAPTISGANFVYWSTEPTGTAAPTLYAGDFTEVAPASASFTLSSAPAGLAITNITATSANAYTITLGGKIAKDPVVLDDKNFETLVDFPALPTALTSFIINGLIPDATEAVITIKQTNPALAAYGGTFKVAESDSLYIKDKTYDAATYDNEPLSLLLIPGVNFSVEVTSGGVTTTYRFDNHVSVSDGAAVPPPAEKVLNLYARFATVKYTFGGFDASKTPGLIDTSKTVEYHEIGWTGAPKIILNGENKGVGTFRGWFAAPGGDTAFVAPTADKLLPGVYTAYAHYRQYYLSVGGTVTGPFSVTDDLIMYPNRPADTAAGAFAGWFTAPGAEGVRFDFAKSLTANGLTGNAVTLYAHFSDKRNVIFLDAYGKAFQVAQVDSGQTIASAAPGIIGSLATLCKTPMNYTVTAWYVVGDGEAFDATSNAGTAFNLETTKVTADIFLRPYIETGKYYVMFNSEGSGVAPRLLEAGSKLDKVEAMPTPKRGGYTFKEWTWDDDNNPLTANIKWNIETTETTETTVTPERTITLYAQWTTDFATYKITYWREKANIPAERENANGTLINKNTLTADGRANFEIVDSITITDKTGALALTSGTAVAGNVAGINTTFATEVKNRASATIKNNYFEYSHFDGATINGDGTTTINVFYTRKIYKLEFDAKKGSTATISGTQVTYTSGTYLNAYLIAPDINKTEYQKNPATTKYTIFAKLDDLVGHLWPLDVHKDESANSDLLRGWHYGKVSTTTSDNKSVAIVTTTILVEANASNVVEIFPNYAKKNKTLERVFYIEITNSDVVTTSKTLEPKTKNATKDVKDVDFYEINDFEPDGNVETFPLYILADGKYYKRSDELYVKGFSLEDTYYIGNPDKPTFSDYVITNTADYVNGTTTRTVPKTWKSGGNYHYIVYFYNRKSAETVQFDLGIAAGQAPPVYTGTATVVGDLIGAVPSPVATEIVVDGAKYTFDNWYTDPDIQDRSTLYNPASADSVLKASGNILYAKWVTVPFTVSFNNGFVNPDTGVFKPVLGLEGNVANGAPQANVLRYKTDSVEKPGAGDLNIMGLYVPDTMYKVDGNDRVFKGWLVSFNNNSAIPPQMLNTSLNVIDDLTISAVWEINGNPYRVEYENPTDLVREDAFTIYGFAPASYTDENLATGQGTTVKPPLLWNRGSFDFAIWRTVRTSEAYSPGGTITVSDDLVSEISLHDGEANEVRLSVVEFERILRGEIEAYTDVVELSGNLTDTDFGKLNDLHVTINEVSVPVRTIADYNAKFIAAASGSMPNIVNIVGLKADVYDNLMAEFYYENFELIDGVVTYVGIPDAQGEMPTLTTWRPVREFLNLKSDADLIVTKTFGGVDFEFIVSDEWYKDAQKNSTSPTPIAWGIDQPIYKDDVQKVVTSATAPATEPVITYVAKFYAHWAHLVKFDLNGEGGSVPSQYVEHNVTVPAPDDPSSSQPRKVFTGWYTASDELWDFNNDRVVTNMTLYAKWYTSFTLTYNPNGGTGGDIPPVSYDKNALVTLPDASAFGFAKQYNNFLGWAKLPTATVPDSGYTAGDKITLNDAMVGNVNGVTTNTNLTLYAVWQPTYTVVFDAPTGEENTAIANWAEYIVGTEFKIGDTLPVALLKTEIVNIVLGTDIELDNVTLTWKCGANAYTGGTLTSAIAALANAQNEIHLSPSLGYGETKIQVKFYTSSSETEFDDISSGLVDLGSNGKVVPTATPSLAPYTFIGWYCEPATGTTKVAWNFDTVVAKDSTYKITADNVLELYARYAKLDVSPARTDHIDGYVNSGGLHKIESLNIVATADVLIDDIVKDDWVWVITGTTVTPTETSTIVEKTLHFEPLPNSSIEIVFKLKANGVDVPPATATITNANKRPIG
jgi:hypothetical protein